MQIAVEALPGACLLIACPVDPGVTVPLDGDALLVGACCLTNELSPLARTATATGAHSVSVMVSDKAGLLRLVYQWPDPSVSAPHFHIKAGAAESQELWEGTVDGESAIGRFLRQTSGSADSFFLVPWPDRQCKVVIAFGFRSRESRLMIPEEFSPAIQLAALAAWSAAEADRLRKELSVVSERLGQRKLVERAKGLLQVQNGWSEHEAYGQLRKLSRQRRKTLAETAQNILSSSRVT